MEPGVAKPETVFDVADVIDRCPIGSLQQRVVGLCCLLAMLDGFDAQSIGFLAPPIAQSLALDVKSFGPLFSASLAGILVGALTISPAGDRWGRKPMLILSTLSFGTLAFITAFSRGLEDLIVARFLTGIGLGGVLPNVIALATDYMPQRARAVPACLISAAMPAGGMVAGLVASALLPHWGWRSVFYVGGAAPVLLGAVLIFALPESVRLLSLKGGQEERVRGLMRRIWPESKSLEAHFVTRDERLARTPVFELLRHGRAAVTTALWLACFMNLLVLYSVISWMPALLTASSLPVSVGVMAITTYSLGAILGSLVQGPLLARFPPSTVFAFEFGLFVLFVVLLAKIPLSALAVGVLACAIGWTIQGAQAGLNALSATFYPPSLRSTGLGWALGVGRIGSIIGPLLGGWALQAAWTPRQIFMAGSVPALCAVVAVSIAIAGGAARAGEASAPSRPMRLGPH
jgi:AAHS family 4-hydroxybenzoate transporter-like MFS transporter